MTDVQRPPTQTIFIFEPHAGMMRRCAAVVEGAGYEVTATGTLEAARAALEESRRGDPEPGAADAGSATQDPIAATEREQAPAALLVAYSTPGVELSRFIHELSGCASPLLVMLDRESPDRLTALSEMNADGFLLRPFSSSTLQAVLSVAERLRPLEQRVERLEREAGEASPQMRQLAGAINSRTGFYQFEFIKDLLVVEVRRAKRYGYPLAILLVGLDPIPDRPELNRPSLQREITGGLAVAIAKSTRDIDIPIHYADDRILVFLPHTDLSGAEEVGRRIKRRIKRITYRAESVTAQLTASVGVAGVSAGESPTFAKLIKDATAALRVAQAKGGDRVMKRVSKTAPEL